MEFVIGVAAAVGVGLFATVIGFDKERSFYPVVLIVIATLYLGALNRSMQHPTI